MVSTQRACLAVAILEMNDSLENLNKPVYL
jgi:hypothetical protein